MKKIIKVLLTLVVAVTCILCNPITNVYAEETDTNYTEHVISNEILTSGKTFTVRYGANTARVTVRYTWRFEDSNYSKKYITGILGGTVTNGSGWVSIGSGSINTSGVQYSDNYQVATIPFSYYGSVGAGNQVYVSQTVTLSMY